MVDVSSFARFKEEAKGVFSITERRYHQVDGCFGGEAQVKQAVNISGSICLVVFGLVNKNAGHQVSLFTCNLAPHGCILGKAGKREKQ